MSDIINDPRKIQFIREFEAEPKPTDAKEAIPFLMRYAKIAKNRNLNFSKEEILELSTALSANLCESDQNRIQELLKYIR